MKEREIDDMLSRAELHLLAASQYTRTDDKSRSLHWQELGAAKYWLAKARELTARKKVA